MATGAISLTGAELVEDVVVPFGGRLKDETRLFKQVRLQQFRSVRFDGVRVGKAKSNGHDLTAILSTYLHYGASDLPVRVEVDLEVFAYATRAGAVVIGR